MLKHTLLSDVMTGSVIAVDIEDTVDKVADIFKSNHIHHIPVTSDSGSLKGIISKSDFLKISYGMSLFRQHNPAEYNQALYRSILVKDIMTKDVVCLHPYDPIEKAFAHFKENQFRAIPIVDKGKLVGIVSTLDLLLHAYEEELPAKE